MGKLYHFWQSYLPATCLHFHLYDNISKYQWNFTKFGMCIDIMEIWFEIAHFANFVIFDRVICPHENGGVLSFHILIYNII